MMKEKVSVLPPEPLPSLPVRCDLYCSQETADRLVRLLEEQRPDLLEFLAEKEKWGWAAWKHRESVYYNALGKIITYLRGVEDGNLSLTRLGMLDFLTEVSRRVRVHLNLEPVPIIGKPLAPSYEGPYPPLPKLPISMKREGIDQALVDQVIDEAYALYPHIFYEWVEQSRRLITSYEINGALPTILPPQYRSFPLESELLGEVVSRLRVMCEIDWENYDDNSFKKVKK